MARLQGTSSINFIDRLECRGTLPEMIDEAERFVKRNVRVAAKVVGFDRREITKYPYSAIREAITSAVTHRDYWRRGAEVRASIFADRIEVQSPGRLPPPLTLATLGEEHVLRNELIAQLLFNIPYIERWNTGVERMRRQMREHGLSEPVFEEVGQTFRVTFYGPGEDILDLIPCPLVFPEPTGSPCPIQHKNWPKGCVTTLATSVGAVSGINSTAIARSTRRSTNSARPPSASTLRL